MKKVLFGLSLLTSFSTFASSIYCEAFEDGRQTLNSDIIFEKEIYPKKEITTLSGRKFHLTVTSVNADSRADILIEVSHKLADGRGLKQMVGGSDQALATYIEESQSNKFHVNCFSVKL